MAFGKQNAWLISLDPGKHFFGAALWEGSVLRWAALETLEQLPLNKVAAHSIVIELPQVYRTTPRPSDLIDLAFSAGQAVGLLGAPVQTVRPAQWKGQVKKDAMVKWIQGRLTEEEKDRIILPPLKSVHHNIYDAIGIGLWKLGRLK